MNRTLYCMALCLLPIFAWAQGSPFTHADTLRGSITPERAWWDLTYYHLQVRVLPNDSALGGSTTMQYTVLKPSQTLQVDLQRPLRVVKIEQDGRLLTFRQDGDAYFVTLQKPQQTGQSERLTVFYEGKPRVAKRPPWDGGLTWARDTTKQWFIATSCQGLGASAWWPCKDHMYDEPDSMRISVTVPDPLTDVSNGQLQRVVNNNDGTHTFDWLVRNPINNYGVNINAATYVHWADAYAGEKGKLPLNFYALPEHEALARKQFGQVPLMLKAFEHWFGPYPFYEDGYKLVETPYLGMEHQSSVTYGNGFKNGYRGRDLSGTGWGLLWDFIIVHESGHEWFANNITYRDVADMWIHESFTNYSENLFVEYYHGKAAGAQYVIGCRKNVRNDSPIIGTYDVNKSGSGDMYYKGGNMLHTIRQLVGDDEQWRQMLRGLNRTFYHQTVTSQQIESYLSGQSGRNLKPIFDQYLRDTRIPVLEYRIQKSSIQYRWADCVAGFDMPVPVCLGNADAYQTLKPTTTWQSFSAKEKPTSLNVDADYYVNVRQLK
ncbi:M1 family metallopeptidase [Fibrella sp. HMF5335]|uniref:M1 family metallopeptidase n=1 Tax=Fibrella rubiginis TaxID=2817060 RepID=A0A939GEY6_9BACT|nr:M1 family metallopeptidase [Fibrella rubiginis]MBO0935193.1 M1 family metallopeptidase [Fibrella rubiginis]